MQERDGLVVFQTPELRNPLLVCGISGWVDAGEVSTGSLRYLIKRLKATRFAEMPLSRYHIYQMPGQTTQRPFIKIEDGVLKHHQLPSNGFYYWQNPESNTDLILFLGSEPNISWDKYAENLIYIAESFQVNRVYMLGGVLDKIPHTKEPPVTCYAVEPSLKSEMAKYAVQFTNYEGPGSFTSSFMYLANERGLKVISLSARVTYYPEFNILIPTNPKAQLALIRRLYYLLGFKLNLSDLESLSHELENKLDFMASQNVQLFAYIKRLESDFQEVKFKEPLEISATEAVEIAEELLRGELGDKNDNKSE